MTIHQLGSFNLNRATPPAKHPRAITAVGLTLILAAVGLGYAFPQTTNSVAATCPADMIISQLQLTDAKGAVKSKFAINENIYLKTTLRNQGSAWSRSSNKLIISQFYSHKPSTVAKSTLSDVNITLENGEYPNNWTKSYESRPGGLNDVIFTKSHSFKKSTAGQYTARLYLNYNHAACENNFTNNQATFKYTVGNPTTPTPTPKPTTTPKPTPTPTTTTKQFNLKVASFTLVDSRGYTHPNNRFAPNEPIYVRFTLTTSGNTSSVRGSTTAIYSHKPNTVPVGTQGYYGLVSHGIFQPNKTYSYNNSVVKGNPTTFKQSKSGSYVARIFADFGNGLKETNESDNQRTANYTVSNTWPQAVINPAALDAIVSKKYKLPSSYVPADLVQVNFANNGQPLRRVAANAMNAMRADAVKNGAYFRLLSGYRSYWTQDSLYWNYVRNYGQAAADTFSARAGHSEHQLGLAADIGDQNSPGCDFDNYCYQNTKSGKWVLANAHKYGFTLSYPKGKEHITGYKYEPWHFRYVGVDLATKLKNSGLTMQEYFKVPGGGY